MHFKLKNVIIKVPKRGISNQFTKFSNKPGKEGDPGKQGKPGKEGDPGKAGISVIGAVQIDNQFFKFEFSDNTFSQQLELPKPREAKSGSPGKPGSPGKAGDAGKAAPTIVDIKAFSRRVIFVFSDGTEMVAPIKFPNGTPRNPGLSFGGMEPPVKDVVGVGSINVEGRNGIFFVSIENDDTVGLPYYFIPAEQKVTIPVNRQHLTVGDITIEGELVVDGEMVVI